MNRRKNPSILFTLFVLLPLLISAAAVAADKLDVVESETGFYYTIQQGDTLWDLSKRFNDSPWLWPELWKENDQVSNPHWIFPGERIRLYQKTGAEVIAKPEPAPVAPEKPAVEKKAPGPFFVFSPIDRVGFIRKPPVPPSGTIFAVQGKKTMISEGDIVYIHQEQAAAPDTFIPGNRYTVFRYRQPTPERDSTEVIGTQHYLIGIVEVIQKKPDMVIAKVLKSFRTIKVDDLLMPFIHHSPEIELKPSTPGIDGQIIISEEHSVLAGDYALAFINKGRADHIEVGQEYSIYQQQPVDDNQSRADLLPPVDFGTFLVLHTEQNTSTVVIIQADNHISAGEKFRTPID